MSEQGKRKYDSSVARIAGNILSGIVARVNGQYDDETVAWAVKMARMVIAEVQRTEPTGESSAIR